MMSSLSLTAQQKDDMKQIHKETKQDLSVFRAEQGQVRENMRAAMEGSVWDESAVKAAIEQSMDLRLQTKLIQAKSKNKVFNQLTSEQQEQFLAKRAEKKDKKGEREGKRRGKGASKKVERLVKALELNSEQEAKLSAMMQSNEAQRAESKALNQSLNSQLAAIIHAKEFDENAWTAIHAQFKDQRLEMAVSKAKARFDLMSSMSAEQREKFAKIMKKSKKGKMHKKGRGDKKRGDRHHDSEESDS
jgi:protein CpxP